ncbi:hypothetical protein RJ639_031241 [Escallonia herrerae]|uniref:MORF/ORRM1/DAG-like MORF domain-containing protein n=1 Tax=Escallonia herrerae TaxID=1293975 RepID=A0AA89BAL3_9ASTE|nr:hypothetical protein RJ639_031241 [Escallonia herrerae]
MATRVLTRSLLATRLALPSSLTHSYATAAQPSSLSSILRLRPLVSAAAHLRHISPAAATIRAFSTRPTTSSLNDSSPNWSNRPPKETILLDGCDFEHWLVVMEKPEGEPTRDEIIDYYIKTLAKVVGSEQEARMKIYSVSTRCYFAFGALFSEEVSYKIKELEKVRWVLPDSYLDVRNKDYGGEPFINGEAVPYDPKYHEEWIRNNARAGERNRRNDRPRNFDRLRNFERRRENMQNCAPMAGQGMQTPGPSNMGAPPRAGMAQGPMGGVQQGNMPPNSMSGGMQQHNMPPNMGGGMQQGNVPPGNMGVGVQQGNWQPNNMSGPPQPNYAGGPPNMGGNFEQRNVPNSGHMPYQSGPGPQRDYYAPSAGGGNSNQTQDMPGRDMPMPPPPNYN